MQLIDSNSCFWCFRWKGENVATTEVSEILLMLDSVEAVNVYGVKVSGQDLQCWWRSSVCPVVSGVWCVSLRSRGTDWDGGSQAHRRDRVWRICHIQTHEEAPASIRQTALHQDTGTHACTHTHAHTHLISLSLALSHTHTQHTHTTYRALIHTHTHLSARAHTYTHTLTH